MEREIERRILGSASVKTDGAMPRLVGYAAKFGVLSEDLGGFREQIRRGAFAKTIRTADVRALWNHDAGLVLGRIKNGTLRLREDDTGLFYEINCPDTIWARDALETVRRGDVSQSSFAFEAILDEWETRALGSVRTLIEVKLYDISPVTFPAYSETSVSVQTRNRAAKLMQQLNRGAGHGPDPQALLATRRRQLDQLERENNEALRKLRR
jgi:hypothetical protein